MESSRNRVNVLRVLWKTTKSSIRKENTRSIEEPNTKFVG